MNHRLSIVALAVVLLFSACVKDGDFDELRHPMVLHGEFDPTYGFPVAWADADLGTLMGFVPSGKKFEILVDPVSGLLTLEKDSVLHKTYTFDSKKASNKALGSKDNKPVLFSDAIVHGNKIGLNDLRKHDMTLKRLDLLLNAYVKVHISGSTAELLQSDAEIYFDTIHMTIDLEDGTTYHQNLYWGETVNAQEMLEGKMVTLLNYDASPGSPAKPNAYTSTPPLMSLPTPPPSLPPTLRTNSMSTASPSTATPSSTSPPSCTSATSTKSTPSRPT